MYAKSMPRQTIEIIGHVAQTGIKVFYKSEKINKRCKYLLHAGSDHFFSTPPLSAMNFTGETSLILFPLRSRYSSFFRFERACMSVI